MCSKRGWWDTHTHAYNSARIRIHTSHATVSIFFPNFIGKNKIPNFWKNAYSTGGESNDSRLSSNKIIALRTHTPYHTPFFCANNAGDKQSSANMRLCVCTINALNKYFSEKTKVNNKGEWRKLHTHAHTERARAECTNDVQCSAALLKFTISKNVKITPKISKNSMFVSASVALCAYLYAFFVFFVLRQWHRRRA